MAQKCKDLAVATPRDVLVIGTLVVTCFMSFALGYLAGRDQLEGGQGSDLPALTE